MPDTTLTAADLRQFTGTEQWHRHGIVRDVLFTDGAKYVADQAGAYWLRRGHRQGGAQRSTPPLAALTARAAPRGIRRP